MQPDQSQLDTGATDAFAHNHNLLLSVLHGVRHAGSAHDEGLTLGLQLERVLIDRATGNLVPFDGETGIEELLRQLGHELPEHVEEVHDGRLTGLAGELPLAGGSALPFAVTLGAGGQIRCAVGPSGSVTLLLEALEALDRHLHVASRAMECDYQLLGEGYNPLAVSPLDVPLVPRTRWTLLNAHLAQTGRYARDVMRCACATHITLSHGNERETISAYQLATALSPLFMFLTDNVRSFRGSGARRCPRMARSLMWEEVDPTRCGIVPGTFDEGFSYDRYLTWLEGLQPILFVDALGTTMSTGKRVTRDIMGDRVLSANEALGLLDTALPYVRLGKDLELLQADALRPRMAAGYAAFVKGIFGSAASLDSARSLLGVVRDEDVDLAAHELRMRGWDATIYGRNTARLVDDLLNVARESLQDADEIRILNEIAEQWDVRMVPRDAFVTQEIRAERGW